MWRDADGRPCHEGDDGWTCLGADGAWTPVAGVHDTTEHGVLSWGRGAPSTVWTNGAVSSGPPGPVHAGGVGPGGRAVALAEDGGTWWREGGAWHLVPGPPWPRGGIAAWGEDGPIAVDGAGVWKGSGGAWVRFLEVFSPTVAGLSADALLVVPGEPDEGAREAPFLWDGATRTPVPTPSAPRAVAGGGPGRWWLLGEDGGWRWSEGGWRRWWSGGEGPVIGLSGGDVRVGEWVLPSCSAR